MLELRGLKKWARKTKDVLEYKIEKGYEEFKLAD